MRRFISPLFLTLCFPAMALACPSELLSTIKHKDSELVVCQQTKNLYQPDQSETLNLFVVENYAPEAKHDEFLGITVSIWQVKEIRGKLVLDKSHPVYQESELGEKLLSFQYQGKEVQYALGDLNNDGVQDFALFTQSGPRGLLILKGLDKQREKFENLGYRQKVQNQWVQTPYFVSAPDAKVSLEANRILIENSSEKLVYPLKGSQYEME